MKAPRAAPSPFFQGGHLSEQEQEVDNGEELIDEKGRNPTQRQLDGDETGPASNDKGWEETNDEPAQGEGGQDAV